MDPIITIGREYGSGGREIGKLVADKLGVPFYDKEILTRAAEEDPRGGGKRPLPRAFGAS